MKMDMSALKKTISYDSSKQPIINKSDSHMVDINIIASSDCRKRIRFRFDVLRFLCNVYYIRFINKIFLVFMIIDYNIEKSFIIRKRKGEKIIITMNANFFQ
jgi:hypothetical protein